MEPPEPKEPTPPRREFAALWSPDDATRTFTPGSTGEPVDLPFLFSPNQRFGPYLIVRPLGKGGMGQVYEADEIESGRRVAVKILSRGIGEEEELERFLREGQLAASLSHPNCVYVFGTSEVQGFPVIVMELVPEGTLKDRVNESPMAMSAAVDAIQQVITGLEAAASIGILHRDVKPSNCFVHRDGRVLVGDFGLSVAASAHAPGDKASGTILGTPGFASPEQLRGDPLDARSDIYSVGATLFYLLTGRAPFDDRSTTALIARVATEPPPPLDVVRPGLPRRLALVVARCLAKTPAERFADYAQLRDALEPFGSARLARGPIARRALAGWIDVWIAGVPAFVVARLFRLFPLSPSHPGHALVIGLTTVATAALYFGLLEGAYGAALGKALFGLRVVDAGQVAPGVRRAVQRALAFMVPAQVIVRVITWMVVRRTPEISPGFLDVVTTAAYVMVLFCTARPSSGYLALHDRMTRTRVVKPRPRMEARERSNVIRSAGDSPFSGSRRIGPYLVPEDVPVSVALPTLVVGFDDRLQRRVAIELLPPGTPPLPVQRRDLDRPARARWLAGRRDGADSWDAYEAVDGTPLADAIRSPQRWSRVRHWLNDLVNEVATGLADGSAPPLEYDRVWIGPDDRVRLIDLPRGGTPADLLAAQRFLYAVAAGALCGIAAPDAAAKPPQTPIPLAARKVLLLLQKGKFASPSAMLDAVASAIAGPAVLPRRRRAMQIAATALFPLAVTAVAIAVLATSRQKDATPLFLWYTGLATCAGTLLVPMFLAAIGAVVTGSGFTFRPFGAALVNRRGARASRVRALWRVALVFSPVVPTLILFVFSKPPAYRPALLLLQSAIMMTMLAGAVWAIVRPSRGIQDRLAGTWIVPR